MSNSEKTFYQASVLRWGFRILQRSLSIRDRTLHYRLDAFETPAFSCSLCCCISLCSKNLFKIVPLDQLVLINKFFHSSMRLATHVRSQQAALWPKAPTWGALQVWHIKSAKQFSYRSSHSRMNLDCRRNTSSLVDRRSMNLVKLRIRPAVLWAGEINV